jgi:2-polyprenyl-6-methoxyphenol hydroxylase-like FAD-dependent oxidoreductase
LGVPRNVLDASLVSEARIRGLVIHERTTVRDVRRDGDHWVIDTRAEDGRPVQWRAGMLVGADGLRSVVARRISAVRPVPANKLSITCHVRGAGPDRGTGYLVRMRGRTVGVAPIHDGLPLWNVTVVVDTAEYAAAASHDRMQLFWTIFDESGLSWNTLPAVVDGPWVSGGFRLPVSRPVMENALLVGDAAGYFDPFTGQGVQQALRSAELAAPVIDQAWRTRHDARRRLVRYAAALRRERRSNGVFQRGVEFVMSRDTLRAPVIAALRGAPAFADGVVQVAGDHRSLPELFGIGGIGHLGETR